MRPPIPSLERKFAHVGPHLLPRRCKHLAENVVMQQDSYNDGGLRVQVTEWFCLMCSHVVRREYGTCDVGRRVWPADLWD